LQEIREAGLEKPERVIDSPHGSTVAVMERDVLNLCANSYLGLADHPEVVRAAKEALDQWGYGMASVRFICGTQEVHKELEAGLTEFLRTEDTILYSSCFDANGGIFEALLDERDAVISDASTTPASSTASASARRSVFATRTATWRTSSASSRRAQVRVSGWW